MLNDYLKLISEFVVQYGYPILFFGVMLENIFLLGLLFPGLFILTMSGFLASTDELNIYLCILWGFLGTIVGDNLSFLLGRYGLVNIKKVKKFNKNFDSISEKILGGNKLFVFILFYHFPIYARMVVPTMLGSIKYNFKKWFYINSFGALLFSSTFIIIGFIIGQTSNIIDKAIDISKIVQWVFFGLFFYFIISIFLTIRKLLSK
jgi:membrane-associated protein